MRTMALGLAVFGLPAMAAAFPLSHAAYRPRESPAPASSPRAEITTRERFALAAEPPRSQHRDDESGAVILELRMGERARTVLCHGHRFPATEDPGRKSPKH